ncbi:MAG: diguanylate cyclase [Sphingomonadaceae bacterium]|nr:diguanylate cyclase [Sphingomonadaceae bacterium]
MLLLCLQTADARAADPWRAFDIPLFEQVLTADGLPQGTVTSMAQDERGLIWIGTFGGLVRYDGYRAQVFRQDASDPHQLRDSYVRALAPLSGGRMMVGTNAGGVGIFDPATLRFDWLPVGAGGTAHGKIFALAPSRRGGYWIATEGGLDHIDIRTRRLTTVSGGPGSDPAFDPRSFAVLEDRRGNLWVGTNDGLLLRRAGTSVFVRQEAQGVAATVLRDKIWALHEDRGGNIWVGSGQSGALYLDPSLKPQLVAGLSGVDGMARRRTLRGFLELDSGVLWAATDGAGVVSYDPSTGEVGRVAHDRAMQASLPGDIVRALLKDRSGNIWIGTEVGAAHFNPAGHVILSMMSSPLNPATLSDPNVQSVWVDPRGRIWLGLGMGRIDVIDQAAGAIRRIRLTGEQAERDVQGIGLGPDGQVWAGSQGLARIDLDSLAVSGSAVPALDSKLVLALAFDGRDVLVGTYDGLFRYSTGSGRLQHFVSDRSDPTSLADNQIRVITPMPGGEIWYSTVTGISISSPGRRGFRTIRHDPADPQSLPHDYAGSVERDARGRIWVGTFGGLALLDRPTPPYRFRRVTAANGLDNEKINALLVDGSRVWASTADGVALIDGDSLDARSLGPRDGLKIDSYIHRSAASSRDGALMFGGLGGLTVVRPTVVRVAQPPAPLAITNLVVNDVALPFSRLPAPGDTLRLASSRRGFRADFALLDYRAPSATRYSHRLLGFDDDWVKVPFGTPPAAAYTNLPGGTYTLELRAQVGGLFPRVIASAVRIEVEPYWYETLWVRALLVLAVLGGIFAIVALRTRLLRQRALRLEGVVAERTSALRDANDRLAALASTDPLTGIGNRRRFLESATQELAIARRDGQCVSLIMVDLDRFKSINDSFGHPVGDVVLRSAASAMVHACRPADIVARFGGEELVALLPETDATAALAIAQAIRHGVAAPVAVEGREISVTVSAGVAQWEGPDETLASLIERADRALYEAKRTGRDRALLARAEAEAPRPETV